MHKDVWKAHSVIFFHLTTWGSVGLQKIRQQSLLDCGIPAQSLPVQDEQEAVKLHQELVQHWKAQTDSRNSDLQQKQKLL